MQENYRKYELEIAAELKALSDRILNLPMPNGPDAKRSPIIMEARTHAAEHLRGPGYSVRQIMAALNYKSTRSVQLLLDKSKEEIK